MSGQNALTFTRSYPPVSEEDVRRYEQHLSVTFPQDYVGFLLRTNGGIPSPRYTEVPEENHLLQVGFLYAIKNDSSISDLVYELEHLASRMSGGLPDGFVVIGHDPGDSKFLLGTRGESAGQVWFWDIARQMSNTSHSENTYWLADSFTVFLNGLHEDSADHKKSSGGGV